MDGFLWLVWACVAIVAAIPAFAFLQVRGVLRREQLDWRDGGRRMLRPLGSVHRWPDLDRVEVLRFHLRFFRWALAFLLAGLAGLAVAWWQLGARGTLAVAAAFAFAYVVAFGVTWGVVAAVRTVGGLPGKPAEREEPMPDRFRLG